MKTCAFLTLCERGDFVIDDELAVQPMADIGWKVDIVSWRQSHTPWSDYDAVVIRSPWDYWNDTPAFMDTLARIKRETRLANPLSLVHWNLAKTYMRDLQGHGVGIVPTLWPDQYQSSRIGSWLNQLQTEELVIKPVVGANGDDAYRVNANTKQSQLALMEQRYAGKDIMVQRFMPSILSEGEYSLFFFAGELSHSILKVPTGSEFRCQEEHGGDIRLVQAGPGLRTAARQVMETLDPMPLYARAEFVRDETGKFVVMELELIEPSMYLRMDPSSPMRFARAIDAWFA